MKLQSKPAKKETGKWELRLWEVPRPTYFNGYPGQVFRRDYPTRGSLHRALSPATRAHPTAEMAQITYFSYEGWCFMQRSCEFRHRCPDKDGWMVLDEGVWTCPHCRQQHPDKTVRPWLTETTGEAQ